MISLDIPGYILCLLVVRLYLYTSVLLPWFTLSSLRLFMCPVLTLLESISPRRCLESLFCRVLLLSSLVNGVAECKHRRLLDTACVLMIATSLPPHFWKVRLTPLPHISATFNHPLLCRVAFLSSVFFIVLQIIQRSICLIVFAMFFLPPVNAPN